MDAQAATQQGEEAKRVKEQEDASQRARLFAYEIPTNMIGGGELEALLERRYGESIVGGRRFKILSRTVNETVGNGVDLDMYRDRTKDVWKNTWVVHVAEDSKGDPLRIGEYLFEPTGDEAEEVELKTMVPKESTMSWGERHG
jgi:hypothetical protein